MKTCYIVRPELKFIPQLSLAVVEGFKISLSEAQKNLILESFKRPLFSSDLKTLKAEFINQCFIKIPFAISHPNDLAGPGSSLILTQKKNAQYLMIEVSTVAVFTWKTKEITLTRGQYIIPFFFPLKISGGFKKSFWKDISIQEMRQDWCLEMIRALKPKRIFELGAGKIPQLGLRIMKAHPRITYQGWDKILDKEYAQGKHFFKKNFLKSSFPKVTDGMYIALEVIEHIPERNVTPLIMKIFKSGANVICLTTPNADFNPLINIKKRRQDHAFEWTKKDLLRWKKNLMHSLNCTVSIQQIGKPTKKVAPTWAVTIKKI